MGNGASAKWGYYLWLLIALAVGLLIGRSWPKSGPVAGDPAKVKRDTVWDTIRIDRPVPVLVRVEYLDTVTLPVAVRDTVEVRDSATVLMPIERKVYFQSGLYYAAVSGFRPNLDRIQVYPQTIVEKRTVSTPERRSGWGFGATIGPSVLVTPSGEVRAGIGASAGLTFSF